MHILCAAARNSAWDIRRVPALQRQRGERRLCCFPGKNTGSENPYAKGHCLNLELLDIRRSAEKVAVPSKDGGDDPDVTDKALIYAEVTFGTEEGIVIDGGFGVGRVTKPGLDQPVGNAAINHVPRQMIRENVEEIQKNSMISAHCRLSSPYRKGKNWQSIHSIRDLASPAAFQSLERAGL